MRLQIYKYGTGVIIFISTVYQNLSSLDGEKIVDHFSECIRGSRYSDYADKSLQKFIMVFEVFS